MDTKNVIIIVLALIIVGGGVYFLTQIPSDSIEVVNEQDMPETTTDIATDTAMEGDDVQADEVQAGEEVTEPETAIGTSVEGRDITAYHYGEGEKELLFIGGIHGGYSWNTVLVAYELMDYLEENPDIIPQNVQVTVIPALNPDGLNKVVGSSGRFAKADAPLSQDETIPGRFNANDVDLNRNFDCDWQPSGTWQKRTVDGGSEVFSEPESQAMKNYIDANSPSAVIVWYSAAGGVFASSCHNGVLPETSTITNLYADASGYKAYEDFDFYEITGDMVNWLAKQQVPAISVLLSTHEDVEWDKNKAAFEALLEHYSN